MKKCVVIPDSFKGTLTAIEFCNIASEQIRAVYPCCEIIAVPVADGGEGTVECFLHAMENGQRVGVTVQGPFGKPIQADYARFFDTAVIEMAQAAGLPMAGSEKNPALTTTYGVGELVLHAVKNGCRNIIIGLGGSATNDAACGMAAALGTVFYNQAHQPFIPTGGTLNQICDIDISATRKLLSGCVVTAICDIDNPMFGKNGAAYVFAPQKGADSAMVSVLDDNLQSLSKVIEEKLSMQIADLPGAGAAGAMGAGIVAFLGGNLKAGIQTILDLIKFEEVLAGADIVFTGEGQIDYQSLGGKVVIGIAGRAAACNVPVVAVVGSIGEGVEGAYDLGVSAIFSINRKAMAFEESRFKTKENLCDTFDSILRFYKATHR